MRSKFEQAGFSDQEVNPKTPTQIVTIRDVAPRAVGVVRGEAQVC